MSKPKKNKQNEQSTRKLKGKKKLMIDALELSMGIVSMACKNTNTSRTQHYYWLKHDKVYKQAVEDVKDMTLDFSESALYTQIKKGSVPSIIFHLKTKGKDRGYVEKTEIQHSGEQGIKITTVIPESVKELLAKEE